MKKIFNILLLVTFIVSIMVPLTGIKIHKISSTLFLIFSLIHIVINRKRLGLKGYLFSCLILITFISGLFGMIIDEYSILVGLHKVLSIVVVFFLAIHIFIHHKILLKR